MRLSKENLLFLAFLFLPTQLGRHFFFDFSYIYSLKIDYFSLVIYFWDILVLGLFLWGLKDGLKIKRVPLFLVLGFLLTQLVSLFGAANFGAGMVRFEQLFIVSLFGLYISSLSFEKIKMPLLGGLVIGILGEGILALMQFSLGRSVGFWVLGERDLGLSTPLIATFNFYGQVFLRPYGTFPHPNVLAGYLAIGLPLMLFIFSKMSKRTNLMIRGVGVTLAVGFLSSILTFSRSTLLVLGVESLMLLKSRIRLFIFLLVIFLPFLFVRFNSAFNFDYLSISRREELAEIAINQFLGHPLMGVGLNNFISKAASSDLVSGENRFLQPVHNILLLELSETGIVGTVGFLILVLYPIFKLIRQKNKEKLKIYGGLFLAIFFLGMFDHYFLTLPQGQRLLFLVWGLMIQEI